MKKTSLIVALCLGFIVAWQMLVVVPYKRKNAALQKPPHENTTAVSNSAQTTETTKASVPSTVNNKPEVDKTNLEADESQELKTLNTDLFAPKTLSSAEIAEAFKVEPDKGVNFRVSKNGAVGRAEFESFLVRGTDKKKTVKIIEDGMRWVSTDPQVALCLSRMRYVSGTVSDRLLFEGKTSAGTCTVEYRPLGEHGKISNTLSLNGFLGSSGFVEFRGQDIVGTGDVLEHNTLFTEIDGSNKKIAEKDLLERSSASGKVSWMVWGDKYFVTVLLPKGKYNPNVVYGGVNGHDSLKHEDKRIGFAAQYPLVTSQGPATQYEMDFAFVTRDQDILSQMHPTLHKAIDLGWFSSVARAMLWGLKKIFSLVHNYGVAIIILTLIVRVVFWPLNKKVFLSGIKMKALAPEMEKLKKKYGGDKSRAAEMNQEMMALYRKHNVNPLGSCLPLLLQMPIFIGLYQALSHSIDLYQAPFFAWITDLSSKDPFYVFPFLWTVSLVAYVFINPQQNMQQEGMPDMKWIMIAMNVFFGFLSASWPSGLTLYLFVSNLIGISQQLFFQRAYKLQPIQEGA